MNILITGAKKPQSFKAINGFPEERIFLADYGDVPSFPSAKYTFISLGERNDDVLAHNLLNACLDNEIDCILPLYNFEIKAVAKAAVLFNEFNIEVLLPEISVLSRYNKIYNPVSDHVIIYRNGERLYSSEAWVPTDTKDLNGAFYVREEDNVVSISLLTVY